MPSAPPPSALSASTPGVKVPKFLRSLYAILETEDASVVAWRQNRELTPNRVTAFHILDMARFEREVLPKYFKHQKFASFQRQLNNFGFRKWTKTQSSGVCTFSHNCFPPDARGARAAGRDLWRRRSPLPNAPLDPEVADDHTPPRRVVGNGVTKADRKRIKAALKPHPHPHSHSHPHSQCGRDRDRNHDRNCDYDRIYDRDRDRHALAGLEAFSSPTAAPFVLPPLPNYHMQSTPRSAALLLPPSALEPWPLDAHAAPLEFGGPGPADADADWPPTAHGYGLVTPRGGPSITGFTHPSQPPHPHQPALHHLLLHDRAPPEDFGLDNLLFVE